MNNRTASAKAPDTWMQIQHNMCGRQAAWSPLWWWPCFLVNVSWNLGHPDQCPHAHNSFNALARNITARPFQITAKRLLHEDTQVSAYRARKSFRTMLSSMSAAAVIKLFFNISETSRGCNSKIYRNLALDSRHILTAVTTNLRSAANRKNVGLLILGHVRVANSR